MVKRFVLGLLLALGIGAAGGWLVYQLRSASLQEESETLRAETQELIQSATRAGNRTFTGSRDARADLERLIEEGKTKTGRLIELEAEIDALRTQSIWIAGVLFVVALVITVVRTLRLKTMGKLESSSSQNGNPFITGFD